MVAGMSSADNLSSRHRRNPHRTCRTISEDSAKLKPVSSDKASILHSKETTAFKGLNTTESCGQRTTKKEKEKPQKANQSAPSDSSACLQNSEYELRGINGLSSKSHKPEPKLPQKITTPKCPSKTSKTSHKGRKKKCVQSNEREVAASKACGDGLDNSVHNSCPEQLLSSPKTKATHYRHSKNPQNHQTPSDVSTGLHTCTTLSPRHHKELSSCHTNGDCTSRPSTPKRSCVQSRPLLSSTPNSDLHPLSPKRTENSCTPQSHQKVKVSSLVKSPLPEATPSRPQRIAGPGRPRGRKKKNVLEQPSASSPVKRCRKRATSPVKSSEGEPSFETQPCIESQEPEPLKSDQTMSPDLSIELSLQEEPHPLNHSVFMQEEEDQDDDEEELPSFLQQDNKKPLSISEGLCVWCKLRKYPYWPAVVKSVNHKTKKASIVFIDCYLIDQKRIRKGFSVPLRNLKRFNCDEFENLVDLAKEKYGSAITWSLELISDYRIRIGCGSFSGSFIEYCAADISCPVRRKYSEKKSVLTFPSQEILGEECDSSDNNMEDIVLEEQDELLTKKVLPDRSKAARNRANELLIDFIIRQKVEKRLLAVISGHETSKWMQALQKPSRPVVDVYLEDEEQVDKVYRYLNKVCDSAPQINTCLENIQVDRIRLILDVLLPEAIIHAIAGVHKLSLEKAEEKYRRGPCFSNRERQEFDMMIEQQMKLKEITQRHRR
ncbi:PWWP domain-containing DNA repair factor 3B isoform X2 [Pimephales promelas]|uniref:PWWP domain-containing DNA repair factor 3B isoform X2 n=1 Tax=Pimephales promelas TaxID=90988 RepID=UPI0019556E78|nr:PWWP domain-containing DNA repair factor 3B isoform X2 [Pimephales promelas]KAG1934855.1 PWWP domain-containing DNA repair factor 3B [Pimephales promelas]